MCVCVCVYVYVYVCVCVYLYLIVNVSDDRYLSRTYAQIKRFHSHLYIRTHISCLFYLFIYFFFGFVLFFFFFSSFFFFLVLFFCVILGLFLLFITECFLRLANNLIQLFKKKIRR